MRWLFCFLLLLMTTWNVQAGESGTAILNAKCAGCHNLTGPAPDTLEKLRHRKGPDLFYAGNKYRAEWMEQWLQHPKRIRPAGMFYRNHIKPGPKHDIIDQSGLAPHLALNAKDARLVTSVLMTKLSHGDLVRKEKLNRAPAPMGEMMFDKINGCMACHQIEPDFGGMSGPEVYTAGKRLKPEFMLSFVKNPQAWDPKTWMPNKHTPPDNVQQLVNYLIDLSKENFDE